MFENYEKQGARPGQTVAYEVTELVNPDGTHPVVHIEHIGRSNASFMQAVIARAGSDDKTTPDDRETMIAHSARRIERVYRADGSAATDADLPAFIRAMPLRALQRMTLHAMDEKNYCEFPIATEPAVLAEK